MRSQTLSAVLILVPLAACGTPEVVYRPASDADIRTQTDGELLFHLRSTNITVLPPADEKAKPGDVVAAADVCATADRDWQACLLDTSVGTTATAAKKTYLATNGNSVPWKTTKLTGTFADDQNTILTGVNVTYNDSSAQIITSAGEGAANGFAFGPWGAVAGGLVGAVSAGVHALNEPPLLKKVKYIVCSTDTVDSKTPPDAQTPKLVLPVTFDLADAADDATHSGCWHLLPVHPPTRKYANMPTFSGWLYRLRLAPVPPVNDDGMAKDPNDTPKIQAAFVPASAAITTSTTDYFHADPHPQTSVSADPDAAKNTIQHSDFPISACHNAQLDIAWWGSLADKEEAALEKLDDPPFAYNTYKLEVADPNYVVLIPLPKTGSIKLGTLCGATVTYSAYTGSTLNSVNDAIAKEAKAIKSAQDDYKKNSKKPSP